MENCSRCGWLCTTPCPAYCPACGAEISFVGKQPHATANSYRQPFALPIKNLTAVRMPDLSGLRKISGTVTTIGPSYMGKEEFVWYKVIAKLLVGVILVPIAIFVVSIIAVTLNAVSSIPSVCKDDGKGKGKKDFIIKIVKELSGYIFNLRHFVLRDEVLVREVRIRLTSGRERLATMPERMIVGNFNIGDTVDIEGINRNGPLFVTGGYNHTTGSRIRLH